MAGIGGGGDAPPEVVIEEQTMPEAVQAKEEEESSYQPPIQVTSLKLGKKPKQASLVESMAQEEGISLAALNVTSKKKKAAAEPEPAVAQAPVAIVVEEKMTCHLSQEGALEQFELKGALAVTANTEAAAKSKVVVSTDTSSAVAGTTFQVHPKVDKKAWEGENSLGLKDKEKGFPVGRAVGVLRWSLQTTDEQLVPFVVNCWPEDEGDSVNVSIEYTLQRTGLELHNVEIAVPLGTPETPQIVAIDGAHHVADETLVWSLAMIDASNATGTLEFNIAGADPDAFFPITVSFTSKSLYWDVHVDHVSATADHSPVQFGVTKALTVDSFKIQ
mmetsp:Transcript_3007/g.9371  ORF Transcript_3007/g.9371 Transcript_3007/m.9371 type:complete len:331 (+) Transcript_3007:2-994(+)